LDSGNDSSHRRKTPNTHQWQSEYAHHPIVNVYSKGYSTLAYRELSIRVLLKLASRGKHRQIFYILLAPLLVPRTFEKVAVRQGVF
jgi:hypothetical protein